MRRTKPLRSKMRLERLLLVPDTHAPFEDSRAFDLMLHGMRSEWRPQGIVVLGDFFDFYSLSAHPPETDRQEDFEDELLRGRARLHQLEDLGAKRRLFIAGNHEQRLERYLARNAPKLYRSLSLPQLLGLKSGGWEYTPYKQSVQIGRVWLTHDTGRSGKYSAAKAVEDFQDNAIIGHCLPIEYEVCTEERGWVSLSAVREGDRVISYSPSTRSSVWSPVSEVVNWKYTGDMAVFNRRGIRQEMTDRHHIFTADGRRIPVQEALASVKMGDLMQRALPMEGTGLDVPDALLQLIVAVCADGSYVKGHTSFHFKKERKMDRLDAIIRELGYEAPERRGPSKTGSYKITLPLPLSREVQSFCPDKLLPVEFLTLTAKQRQLVIDELEHWDGSRITYKGRDYGSRQFSSNRPEEINRVQQMLTQHGLLSSLRSEGRSITYNLAREQEEEGSVHRLSEAVDWTSVENREVGCITTGEGNFFVRNQKGEVTLSGNTHRLEYFVTGTARGIPHVGASFGWLGDATKADYMHAIKAKRDWALGFGLATHDLDTGCLYVQPVPIIHVGGHYSCLVGGTMIQEAKR